MCRLSLKPCFLLSLRNLENGGTLESSESFEMINKFEAQETTSNNGNALLYTSAYFQSDEIANNEKEHFAIDSCTKLPYHVPVLLIVYRSS